MTRTTIVIAAGLALAVTLPIAPAQATGVSRTFVSAAGSDSNTCANVATPCRHFAAAYAATAPSGEIFVLDPANYGSLTITGPVSIEGHGWASIAPPNNGNAVTINANPSDNISIRGVAINGIGATGGTNGIVFNSGGGLTVTDCVVQNFVSTGSVTGFGILMQPTSGTFNFAIANTTFSNNTFGVAYEPPSGSSNANGVIDHVIAINANTGGSGIAFNTVSASGGHLVATISNSTASNNGAGVFVTNASSASSISLSIDNLTASGNAEGIFFGGTPSVVLGRSVITGNGSGLFNATSPNTINTYGNNQINLNATADINGPSPSTTLTPR